MTLSNKTTWRRLIAGTGVVRLLPALAALLAACSPATPPRDLTVIPIPPPPCPKTPNTLAPSQSNEVAFALDAQGTQRYSCTPGGWSAAIPDAELFSIGGTPVLDVHHFGGPTWLWSDSSSVTAAKVAAETVDSTAIPWLLLNVTGHGGLADGRLAGVTQIQRLTTTGGLAPAAACDAVHVGLELDAPYTARYWFYRAVAANGSGQRCGG